ncbi:hypothetical protein SDC9_89474 [bioreactor metagenome]|uniref:Uncharacterized protein n=1 Tax=bioreactor metagenome TaxID=1076179 RepID=A0A644ZVZ1_9ZZZZ|nr:hypothetical protein [Christensenella sp.]
MMHDGVDQSGGAHHAHEHAHEAAHSHLHTHTGEHAHSHEGLPPATVHTHEHTHSVVHDHDHAHAGDHSHTHELLTESDLDEAMDAIRGPLGQISHSCAELAACADQLRRLDHKDAADALESAILDYTSANAKVSECLFLLNQ